MSERDSSYLKSQEKLKASREGQEGEPTEIRDLSHAMEIINAARVEVYAKNPAAWDKLNSVTNYLKGRISEESKKYLEDDSADQAEQTKSIQ